MAESSESEGANNRNEQEMDAGMDQHSVPEYDPGGALQPVQPVQPVLLLGDVPEGAGPPAHVARLLDWIRADAGLDAGLDGDPADQAVRDMDALLGLVYVLVLETGFTPLGLDDGFAPHPRGSLDVANLRRVARMPPCWRSRDADAGPRYVLDFALGVECEGAASARLVGVVCSDTLIVNMIAADAAFSLVLVPADYVRGGAPRNLRALSLAVKDRVSARARAAVLNARGVTNPSLLGMPAELLVLLGAMLPVHDLAHLAATCSALQQLMDDPGLWRMLVRRQHPALFRTLEAREQAGGVDGDVENTEAAAAGVDWKKEFRAKRAEEQEAAAARQRELLRSRWSRCGRSRWLDSW